MALVGVALYQPILDYFNTQKREEILAVVQQGDVSAIQRSLSLAQALEDDEQTELVLADERFRDAVIQLMRGGESGLRSGLAIIQGAGLQTLRRAVQDHQETKIAIASLIAQGDEESITAGLRLIEPFDDSWERSVKEIDEAKQAVVQFFTDRIWAEILPEDSKWDYPTALKHLDEFEVIYPGSADGLRIRNELKAHRGQELTRLDERYRQLLAQGSLIPDAAGEDIGDVLANIATIDREHPALSDAELPSRFADRVRESVDANDYQLARRFLEASVAYAPDDPTLVNLRHEVTTELKRQADEKLAAEIQQRLEGQWRGFATLDDFAGAGDDLIKLAEVSPTNPVLAQIVESLQRTFDREFTPLVEGAGFEPSEALLAQFAALMDTPFVTERRARLSPRPRTGTSSPMPNERRSGNGRPRSET